jgi:D-alanyl-lipoteichoic acid acyltransferase DltB (MBOAT superfamily)
MTLTHILAFTAAALGLAFLPNRLRIPAILAASLVGAFWLQTVLPLRGLDFWLPAASIGLTAWVWALTRPPNDGRVPGPLSRFRPAMSGGPVILAVIFGLGLTHYLGPLCCLTASRPPEILPLLVGLTIGAGIVGLALYFGSIARAQSLAPLQWLMIAWMIITLILLKSDPLAHAASAGLRTLTGQSPDLASPLDLRWIGFSYLAFRLIAALRDAQAGRFGNFSLAEFGAYALFFPAYTAGPIDRMQHAEPDLHTSSGERLANLTYGLWRILLGVFKKFALADSLALVALNPQNAIQVRSPFWMWLLLYAYALRIYFDFAGYTDIALGLARLLGVRLPENFAGPYLKTNLTQFWNSWHMSLAQWFRAYWFNPLTRALRTGRIHPPAWLTILLAQFSTMLLIGLWHGLTWNFAVWGVWHAAGLYIHNRWSEWAGPRLAFLDERPGWQGLFRFGGWLLTFNYVCLGWVWFALPQPSAAIGVLRILAGG